MTDKLAASRKRVFVDKKFQTKFILKYSLLLIIGTMLFSISAYFILNQQIGESLFSAHLAIHRTGELLLPTLLLLSLTFVVILGVAAVFITLMVSHKICGPLFAIERYLKLISEGNLNFEAKLRTNDQTEALADTLTETVKSLRGRIVMAKESVTSLKKDLDRINVATEKGTAQGELARTVHDLQEHCRILEDHLAHFQTE